MRLTVLGPGFPSRGGIATTTTALVQTLGERGHQVQFLTPTRQYPRWLYPGGDDRDPEACSRVQGATAVFAPLEPWTWRRARRQALDFEADAWVLPYWTWVWAPFWRYVIQGVPGGARPAAIAVVHNVHDHDVGSFRQRVASGVLRRCQAFLTHAEVLESALNEAFPGVPAAAYPLPAVPTVRPVPERSNARRQLGVGGDERLALFVGLIRPYKGVDVLLEAFSRLPPDSKWRLVVAGEPWGDLGQVLIAKVEDLGLDDRVRLDFRWIPEGEIDQLLRAADLLVLPYRSGSQSAVAPMALSRGLPVLSTDVGGLGEIVEDGVSGMLVEPNSSDALAKALVDLEGERLEELADGAVTSSNRWTWGGYAGVLEELVKRIEARY